jgi:hypothetical protein
MKNLTLIGLLVVSLGAQKAPLTIADIEPALAGTSIGEQIGFADQESIVTYMKIGKPSYDDFFKTSAKLNGLSVLATVMTTTATGQLKNFAMSKAADEAMQENIKEFVGDVPPEEWSTEQSMAVMRMAKEQDKLSMDEVKYFATTSLSMGIVAASLAKGVGEVGALVKDGNALIKNIKKAKLKLRQIAPTVKGLKGSIKNLKNFKANAPVAAEEMAVLVKGFKMLSES